MVRRGESGVAIILHVISRGDWEAARLALLYRPPSLAAEGFIHCYEGEAQALAVAERLFAGQTDLLLLENAGVRRTRSLRVGPDGAFFGRGLIGGGDLPRLSALWSSAGATEDRGSSTGPPA